MPHAEERFYRVYGHGAGRRVPFRVQVGTTDLYVRADRDLSAEVRTEVLRVRRAIEDHIATRRAFETALEPLELPAGEVPFEVSSMYRAGLLAGVGPMAAVAGTVAGAVGGALRPLTREVLVENGGDVYLELADEAVVGIYAGRSSFSGRLGIRVLADETPLAVCTSSGTVGPSLSYGRADAAIAVSSDPALADAVATALGNRVRGAEDLQAAVEWALSVDGVRAATAILGDRLAAAGEVEFVECGGEG